MVLRLPASRLRPTNRSMTQVRHETIALEDEGVRLDRWFRHRFPQLGQARLEKLLRTGQVRLDGKRARGGARLSAGQVIRIPPMPDAAARPTRATMPHETGLGADLRDRVLYRDADVLVIDKPAGLAVQGGAGTPVHLDGLMAALQFDAAEPPRLVHRLDRDTAGVLVLARHRAAARALTAAFRARTTRKLYWAAVAGRPSPPAGRIDLPLAKQALRGGERMAAGAEDGDRAVTLFRTIDHAHRAGAWLALMPLTGRTHQLRAHCLALGVPILGDGKYGGAAAFVADLPPQVHLLARRLLIAHPAPGRPAIDVSAALPTHMRETWDALGFHDDDGTADTFF